MVRERKKANKKKIDELNKIQEEFGGYRPDLILMYFAKRLDCLTKALIAVSILLGVLAIVQVFVIVCI